MVPARSACGTASNPLCNDDYSYWDIGSRTQWDLDSISYLSLDVVYTHLNTASAGATTGAGVNTLLIRDQSAWIGHFRVHRNFYPRSLSGNLNQPKPPTANPPEVFA